MERWRGKLAVVTGASVGIGAAIVRRLLDDGLIVVGLARRVEKIKELTDDPEAKLHAVECDVTNEENVITAFAWIKENFGPIDVFINSAGITKESSLIEGSLEDWRRILEVNVLGFCVCTREAVRSMRDSRAAEPILIIVSSLAGDRVPDMPGFGAYPASKRALAGLAQTLRHELARTKIRVSTISPGVVATELMDDFSTVTPEIFATLPALMPKDVAQAVAFILSMPSHVLIQDIVLRSVGESW